MFTTTTTPSETFACSLQRARSDDLLHTFAERLVTRISARHVEEQAGHMELAHAAGHMSGAHIDVVRLFASLKLAAIEHCTAESRASLRALRWPERKRPERIALRRWQAALSYLPAKLAQHFTLGQQAVLAVVGPLAVSRFGCGLPHATIARQAGVGKTTARDTLKLAQHLGLVKIMERRVRSVRSLPNVVRVTSTRWKSWLLKRREKQAATAREAGGGSKNADTVLNKNKAQQNRAPERDAPRAARRDARVFEGQDPFASPDRPFEGLR